MRDGGLQVTRQLRKAVVVFKIRTAGRWEDSPVIYEALLTEEHAFSIALDIADLLEREVRWNWKGAAQGHYVGSIWKLT